MNAPLRNSGLRALRRATAALAAAALWLTASAFTVVIDPGHGGKDHGTLGATQREKDINLDVALKLRDILMRDHKDVKVVMTRSSDVFIPLQERCNIANKNKGDIFVSIHTNSVDLKNPRRSSVEGASVYTLGRSRSDTNLDVAMRENSVIKLEDDYTSTYCGFDPSSAESYIIFELAQSAYLDNSIRLADDIQHQLIETAGRKDMGVRQEAFWVLVRTSMPAVLVELDYVCNPTVEKFLGSDEGRKKLARAIANGIATYRGVKVVQPEEKPAPKAEKAPAPKAETTPAPEQKADTTPAPDKKPPRERGARSGEVKTRPEVVAATEEQATQPGQTYYKIQFLLSRKPVSASDARLKGLDADYYRDGDYYKYTTGNFMNRSAAEAELSRVRHKFPDAFIVTFRDGQRVK